MNLISQINFLSRAAKSLMFFCVMWSLSLMPGTLISQKTLQPNVSSSHNPITESVTLYSPENEKSSKKIARNGVLVRYKDAIATILVAHGYMCDKFDVAFLRNIFPQGKYNFLTFDFRAHGENTQGQSCTLGRDEALDVITAAQFIKNHPDLKNKPLYVYAFSMGAVASIEAQAKDSTLFDAMILDCPFDSTANVLKRCVNDLKFSIFGYEFAIPGKTLLQKYAFHPYVQSMIKVLLRAVSNLDPKKVDTFVHPVSPEVSIAKVHVPCFFIHCKNDEKVPVSAIKSVFASASGPKMLWLTRGRKHYDSYFYNPEGYMVKVQEFLDQVHHGKWKNSKEQRIIEDADDTIKI